MKRMVFFLWMTFIVLSNGWWCDIPVSAQSGLEDLTAVRGLALHPNGQILAIGGRYNDQPGIWFYDLTTETLTGIPTAGNVSMLSWRPDGTVIAASVAVSNDMIQVYNTSGVILFEFVAESGRKQVLWSADGSQFMTQGDSAYLRDGSTGEMLQAFEFPGIERRALTGIAWSETYNRLYGTFDVDPEILVWDTLSGEVLTSFPIPFVSWGPQLNHDEDRLAVGSNEGDGRVLILDVLTGGIVQDFANDAGGFVLVSPVWSPDDTKLAIYGGAVAESNPIWIWDVVTEQFLHSVPVQDYTSSQVFVWSSDSESLIFSDGQRFPITVIPPIANAGPDQTVTDSDGSGSELVTLDGSASMDPDGTIVSYSWTENGVEIATGVSPQVDLAVGTHTITLTVTDDDGATGIDDVIITGEIPIATHD